MATTTWDLTGNAGTNPATNFLGTKDSKPLSVQPGAGDVGIGTRRQGESLRYTETGMGSLGL